ncbi:MAG TPA: MFS transporter, partial [Candidatus Acetothermia bacterium]|nr:MFS transporter [Candidatus Acetothermia bacterium]
MAEARVFGLPAEKGRWGFVGLGFVANVCMGAVYAFSVFRKPLEAAWGIPPSQVGQLGYPFMAFLAV